MASVIQNVMINMQHKVCIQARLNQTYLDIALSSRVDQLKYMARILEHLSAAVNQSFI